MTALSMVEKAFLLKKIKLFTELELDLLLTVSENLATLTFKEGETIFSHDQSAHRMYFLVEGCVEAADAQDRTLEVMYPLDYFGDEALFNEEPRAYTARCVKDCQLLTLSRSDLLHILSECPSVGIAMLRAYSVGVGFRGGKKIPGDSSNL